MSGSFVRCLTRTGYGVVEVAVVSSGSGVEEGSIQAFPG